MSGRWKSVWRAAQIVPSVAILVLCASPTATARQIGASLQGDELLVELQRQDGGAETAGIYCWKRGDKALRKVITFGRCPRWSPSRRAFAFDLGMETWIVELAEKRSRPIQDVVTYLPDVTRFHDPSSQYSSILWHPSEDYLIRWRPSSNAKGLTWPVFMPEMLRIARDFPRIAPLLSPDSGLSIGRVSFSPEGDIAYERFAHAWDGSDSKPSIWIRPVMSDASPLIEANDTSACLNPLWAPGGMSLAVDCVGKAGGSRQTHVYDGDLQQSRPIPFVVKDWDDWMQGVEWSPDGNRLLVVVGPGRGLARRRLHAVEVPSEGPPKIGQELGMHPVVYDARWSPSGQEVAILGGQETLIGNERSPEIIVVASDGAISRVQYPGHLRATAIDW